MPTTPNYGLPYPAGIDPPQGHHQIKALAEAVDDAPIVSSDDIVDIVKVTQAQYDALDPPNATTLYVVVD